MRNNAGFTLMEVVIVLIILGVMAGVTIPGYQEAVEKSRSNEAITNLQVIYMAQKAYALDHSHDFFIPDPPNDLTAINTNLKIDLQSKFYTIAIEGDVSEFTAVTERDGKQITIDERGCFGGGSAPSPYVPENKPGC